jgi:hypothetical protein
VRGFISPRIARLLGFMHLEKISRGYPLSHLDDYRDELESHYHESLTHSSHIARLIPVLAETVSLELKELFSGKLVSIIFDGGVYDI